MVKHPFAAIKYSIFIYSSPTVAGASQRPTEGWKYGWRRVAGDPTGTGNCPRDSMNASARENDIKPSRRPAAEHGDVFDRKKDLEHL
jgi:hypothetical protein